MSTKKTKSKKLSFIARVTGKDTFPVTEKTKIKRRIATVLELKKVSREGSVKELNLGTNQKLRLKTKFPF